MIDDLGVVVIAVLLAALLFSAMWIVRDGMNKSHELSLACLKARGEMVEGRCKLSTP